MNEVAELTGGTPVGQEYWIKTEESLTRKIFREMDVEGVSAEEAATGISDVLRYTVTYPGEVLTGRVEIAVEQFRRHGYTVTSEIQNSWIPGNPYKGIHVDLASPDGWRFEFQLHTPESWELKGQTHSLYKTIRNDGMPLDVRQRAYDESVLRSSQLSHPPGIERIGAPRIYGRPE